MARLTDYQIEHWYRKPLEKRAAEHPQGAPGASGASAPVEDVSAGAKRDIDAGRPPSRAAMVNLLMTFGGMKLDEANREYDAQHAVWLKMQGEAK